MHENLLKILFGKEPNFLNIFTTFDIYNQGHLSPNIRYLMKYVTLFMMVKLNHNLLSLLMGYVNTFHPAVLINHSSGKMCKNIQVEFLKLSLLRFPK